ncbi:MAG: phosphate signaling complex protein PhoU [Actinobacteria bacterium]|nr:phosphate signaling complex protein PhoU [Actinomycetota bacterium]MCG2789836.1 phosphate signaling complex protein PhoU [Actinomycetes bacterium]
MRKTFEHKLDEVTEDVIVMGSLVQNTVNDAINSLINGDVELAQKVIDGDDKIDDYDVLIEQKCMFIQAEHQPVAKDLRLIHSIYIIIIYLERIGDICVSIGKLTRRLYLEEKKQIRKEILDILIEMGSLVKTVLDKALKAFKNKDYKLAAKLEQIDDAVDDIQKMLYQKIYSIYAKDEDYIKLVTNISLASRYLERIGDNAVNIGDRVLYYLTGDFKSIHSDLQ